MQIRAGVVSNRLKDQGTLSGYYALLDWTNT